MHGQELGNYAYGMWPVVVFNILLFLFFAIGFLKPKKKIEWRTMGAFAGFLVALFTEMYGFPLTIYFLTSYLGKSYPALNPFSHSSGHLVLVALRLEDSNIAMISLHIISNAIILIGFYLIYQGWILIHAAKGDKLVTEGIYAKVRHPQYDGIFLVTVGFLVQWPSLTTLIMWPILIGAYYRLAMKEEKELTNLFGQQYKKYCSRVPAFIPNIP
jgi:protein-S-isoprenylcysteine O-methyltransferase Ste14